MTIVPGGFPRVSDQGAAAVAVLRVAAAVEDGETVTIGADVYEADTTAVSGITTGNIRVDVSGGSTVASQGTLTIAEPVTADDTMTVGATVYTFKAGATAVVGEIGLGADEAATKVAIVAAINGTDGVNSANASVSAAAFSGDACVLTALIPGTVGDAIVTTETFTHVSNIFDAGTLGTTAAGVDPTAGEFSDALIAAINASGTENVTAYDISANEVLIASTYEGSTTPRPATDTTALAETLAGTNNAWDTAALRGGRVSSERRVGHAARVPNAAEVALGNLHVVFPFTPTFVHVEVRVTATGIVKAWVGGVTITGGRVTLDNAGATDWAATDTVYVYAAE